MVSERLNDIPQCANLTEGFARKKRVMFLRGVDTPIHTMLERYQLK